LASPSGRRPRLFAEREHAERFQERFGGELMDLASRPK
jgi:hypothetical protein